MSFVRGGHIDTLCLACAQIPGSQKESVCLAQTTLFAQFRHGEPFLQAFWDPSPNPSSQMTSKGLRIAVSGLHVNAFLHLSGPCLRVHLTQANPGACPASEVTVQ